MEVVLFFSSTVVLRRLAAQASGVCYGSGVLPIRARPGKVAASPGVNFYQGRDFANGKKLTETHAAQTFAKHVGGLRCNHKRLRRIEKHDLKKMRSHPLGLTKRRSTTYSQIQSSFSAFKWQFLIILIIFRYAAVLNKTIQVHPHLVGDLSPLSHEISL